MGRKHRRSRPDLRLLTPAETWQGQRDASPTVDEEEERLADSVIVAAELANAKVRIAALEARCKKLWSSSTVVFFMTVVAIQAGLIGYTIRILTE